MDDKDDLMARTMVENLSIGINPLTGSASPVGLLRQRGGTRGAKGSIGALFPGILCLYFGAAEKRERGGSKGEKRTPKSSIPKYRESVVQRGKRETLRLVLSEKE